MERSSNSDNWNDGQQYIYTTAGNSSDMFNTSLVNQQSTNSSGNFSPRYPQNEFGDDPSTSQTFSSFYKKLPSGNMKRESVDRKEAETRSWSNDPLLRMSSPNYYSTLSPFENIMKFRHLSNQQTTSTAASYDQPSNMQQTYSFAVTAPTEDVGDKNNLLDHLNKQPTYSPYSFPESISKACTDHAVNVPTDHKTSTNQSNIPVLPVSSSSFTQHLGKKGVTINSNTETNIASPSQPTGHVNNIPSSDQMAQPSSMVSPASSDQMAQPSSMVSPASSDQMAQPSSKMIKGEPKDSRYINTMNALEKAGLLDITLQTAQLIKKNATLQKDIDMLEEIVKVTKHMVNEA